MHRLLLLALLVPLVACDPAPAEPGASDEVLSPVRVAKVRAGEAEAWQRFPGVVRARDRARPAFLHPGTLSERRVVRGEQVEPGQALAVLHNPSLAPAMAAAEGRVRELDARIEQLRRDLERARALRDRELISEGEVDRLAADLDATREARQQAIARREEAREQVEEMTLRAPFAAEVSDFLVEPGDFVAAGQPVMVLSGTGGLEVEIRIPASMEARLAVDQSVYLTRPLQAGRFEGRIEHIGRAGNGLAPVVVALEEATGLAPGASLRVHFGLAAAERLELPLNAILDPGGHAPYVLRVNAENIIERVPVSPGRLSGEWISVEADLAVGDRIVVAGQSRAVEGEPVRVLP